MTMTLITAPTQRVVETAALMAHLRVTSDDERALVEAMEQAAVAHLDGWRGILGRAIRPQTWKQEFTGWGTLRLAMPDVSAITVTGLDADGGEVTATRADLRADCLGPYVLTEGPAVDRVFVQFTCGLPVQQLPAVQAAVKMIVGHWFDNRSAVIEGAMTEVPMAATALIGAMRWRQM
jgi:uncharacterized phiE125 gp8 family phage protein